MIHLVGFIRSCHRYLFLRKELKNEYECISEMVLDVISSSVVDGALSTKYLDEIPLTGARPQSKVKT